MKPTATPIGLYAGDEADGPGPLRMRHDDYRALPDDIHKQRMIRQGHPPEWVNREGGDYDPVVLGGEPGGLAAATTAAASGYRVPVTSSDSPGGAAEVSGADANDHYVRRLPR